MAQNDAASRLVDPETAGGNGDSQASSPASDPQIEALLQACAAAGSRPEERRGVAVSRFR